MVLCGLACRGRHRPFGLCLWLFLSLLAVWVAASALVYGLCRIASPGSVDYAPFLGIGLLMVAVTFATLLPFLILSSVSPFFRERLKALLHVKPDAPAVSDSCRLEFKGSAPMDSRARAVALLVQQVVKTSKRTREGALARTRADAAAPCHGFPPGNLSHHINGSQGWDKVY